MTAMTDLPPSTSPERRRDAGRRGSDVTAEELGKLAALAGARVDALQDVGNDIAKLTTAVASLAVSIESMATKEEVEAASAAQDAKRRRQTFALAAVGTVVAILLALPSILVWVALGRLQDVADQNAVNGRLLVECTTPTPPPGQAIDEADKVHECSDRNGQEQAKAVGSLTFATLDAAICARTEEDPARLEACFVARQTARATTTTTRP